MLFIKSQVIAVQMLLMKMMCADHFYPMCFVILQKLSALSASLARVVSAEDEEAEVDQFPVEGVRK